MFNDDDDVVVENAVDNCDESSGSGGDDVVDGGDDGEVITGILCLMQFLMDGGGGLGFRFGSLRVKGKLGPNYVSSLGLSWRWPQALGPRRFTWLGSSFAFFLCRPMCNTVLNLCQL